ncbi:nucleotidyltransferase domain-containing protein [Piscibacillus salipiscarius]|uniref:nucleotidyltransferase domain-containing protein n=1 Tax=Piscibacillus salipiscarius TaxID=299480 RepID=UPI0006D27484
MTYNWSTCPKDIREWVFSLNQEMNNIVPNIVGIYLHGSIAMGGFEPNRSDIDLIVITKDVLSIEHQRELAELFLNRSNSPFPIEISFLNSYQVNEWTHPCPFDFHYSEYWREKYEQDLKNNTQDFLNNDPKTDADLAAHITILNHRGICLEGKPISEVFPQVPKADYISSIMLDYHDCLNQILVEPDYCVPNLIRVIGI